MSAGGPISTRPTPGAPRPYHFPGFERTRLANGVTVITVDLPGRPLVSANLILANGAVDEPAAVGGATVLGARALIEGTERYDAVALVEASERLGADLHAEASWDATIAGVEVPVERLGPALELLAEVVRRPTFPASEVDRLRDLRLNDILQARSDPRRRADEVFAATIYAPESPYARPSGGGRETVAGLDREILRTAYARGVDPARTTIVVGGDLSGVNVREILGGLFADWAADRGSVAQSPITAAPSSAGPPVRLVHRPGSVQTEIRVGHVGLPRRIPDFHAVSVMSTILGGLFNSRLNMRLREEKGYTYGAGAGFDLRRGPGPFVARTAVNTEATVPALADLLTELRRMRDEDVTESELRAARDYLVGVFPLRFETTGPVVGAISGLVVHGLPDDELARYRPMIEAVTADHVRAAARAHLRLEDARIVLVGDADAVGADLEGGGFGDLEVVRDEQGAEGALPDEDGAG